MSYLNAWFLSLFFELMLELSKLIHDRETPLEMFFLFVAVVVEVVRGVVESVVDCY